MLEARGLVASYGAAQVLFGVDLVVGPGEAVALMGRNGMGKTTLIRTLMGQLRARAGTVHFAGRLLTGGAPHAAARAGLGLVPEGRQIFPTLTVTENLQVAARPGPWTLSRIHALFPRLAERAANRGDRLSGGEQQMLAIGRALMTNPLLLILDEATEGLAPLIRTEIFACLRSLRAEGLSILLVDKHLAELAPVMDRAVILERGRVAWSGTMAGLLGDASIVERHLHV
jgi:branched-chain amino acid transport system ATP-binding protein